jgi:hypothetical protein
VPTKKNKSLEKYGKVYKHHQQKVQQGISRAVEMTGSRVELNLAGLRRLTSAFLYRESGNLSNKQGRACLEQRKKKDKKN